MSAMPVSAEPIDYEALIAAALQVRARAYAPYSKFLVGAALLTDSGQTFVGCNVENASYSLTQCAERTAVTSAVAAGERNFAAIAIAGSDACYPCGACRQVLAEFAPDLPIIIVDSNRPLHRISATLGQLLPGQFKLKV